MVPEVVVVGSANYDIFSYSQRLPLPGETLKSVEFKTCLGGKGANQAVMASRLYSLENRHNVALICKLGSDAFGKEYMDFLVHEGLNTDGAIQLCDVRTGIAQINVSLSDGENTIVIIPGANAQWFPVDLQSNTSIKEMIQNCKVLLVQNEIPIEATLEALRVAKRSSTTNVNTIFSAAPAEGLIDCQEAFELADIVICNKIEGLQILGITTQSKAYSASEIAKDILEKKKCGSVIVSNGREGCIISRTSSQGTITTTVPAHFVPSENVVDTVGAGDSFAGALGFFIAHNQSLEVQHSIKNSDTKSLLQEATRRAVKIAAYTIQKKGATTSYPYKEDISDDQIFESL